MVKLQNSVGQLLFLQSKIEIILTSGGSMVTRYKSWERFPGDIPPQELVTSSRLRHLTLKIPTHLHI